MDATFFIGRKRSKSGVEKEEETGLGGTSISDLSDDLLRHISSFLPIKDAVRTSIVSKAWQHHWKSVPNLIFTELLWTPSRKNNFINFVERMLTHRDYSNIEKFHLSCAMGDEASRISTWLSAAASLNVKDLHVCLHAAGEDSLFLPQCLCASKALIKLSIHVPCILKLPSSVSLSELKILTLMEVIFTDDLSTHKLFSLPTLERLEILGCQWKNHKAVNVCAPRLQRLHIMDVYFGNWRDLSGCIIRIRGACLTYFQFHGVHINDYCLLETSSLVEGEIYTKDFGDRSGQTAYRAYRLLEGLSNVESLKLSTDVLNVLDDTLALLVLLRDRLTFNNLTTLWFSSDIAPLNRRTFWVILRKSPHLRVLHLKRVSYPEFRPDWQNIDVTFRGVPTCFLSCIQRIEVHNFDGYTEELNAIKFLLKIAIFLEEMVVTCRSQVGSDRAMMILQRLRKIPRWLKIGKINFV